ncbi:MAG: hypothetical protein Q8O67_29005 [Deltaproteobacteria bacterium]|nr:hypothetical protein [Deltaproteobacteria bacterium]
MVADAVPWLALAAGVDVATAPTALQAALLGFADRAGLKPGMSSDTVRDAIAGYFADHPLPDALLRELGLVARAITTASGDAQVEQRRAAARLLGDTVAHLPAGQGAAPAGALKNSPLARFSLVVPKKPD